MCTLAFYFRVFADCPLLVAANRDERYSRPAAPPHLWDIQPSIVAGKDLVAGGTWLGVNRHGLLVGILNRRSGAAPKPDCRSRGLLCLDLLRFKGVVDACAYIQTHRERYAPFTVVFADSQAAWTAFNTAARIEMAPLAPGLHVFSNSGLHDQQTEKKQRAYQIFSAMISQLNPTVNNSMSWASTLARALGDHQVGHLTRDPKDAICVHSDDSGTVSSGVVGLFAASRHSVTFYCAGAPCQNSFEGPIALCVS